MQNYVDLLKDELADAKCRLGKASVEGRPVIMHQIGQIERDIRRNSASGRDHSGNTHRKES